MSFGIKPEDAGKLLSMNIQNKQAEVQRDLKTLESNLSDNWRVTKSSIKVLDLANALESLRRVIGYTGVDWPVTFNTKPDGGTFATADGSDRIVIDPIHALTKNTWPIPAHQFDITVGTTVHEAMHVKTEASRLVRIVGNSVFAEGNAMLQQGTLTYGTICVVGEEIVADFYGERHYPKLAEYLRIARKAYLQPEEKMRWDNPIWTWLNVSVYGADPTKYKGDWGIISPMFKYTKELKENDLTPFERIKVYEKIWNEVVVLQRKADSAEAALRQLLKNSSDEQFEEAWQEKVLKNKGNRSDDGEANKGNGDTNDVSDDNSDSGDNNDSDTDNENNAGEDGNETDEGGTSTNGKNGKGSKPQGLVNVIANPITPHHQSAITEELAQNISKAEEEAARDMAGLLDKLAHETGVYRSRVSGKPFVKSNARKKLNTQIDEKLFKELEFLRRIKNEVGKQTLKGELRGRIDKRRLHRYFSDGLYRKRDKKLPEKDLDIAIVVDASGSMTSHMEIYDVINTVKRAVPESKVFDYDNDTIFAHPKGNSISQITPRGTTGSGDAIITVADENPESLILHFTDGGINSGIDMDGVYKILRQKYPKVTLVNIIWQDGAKYPEPAPRDKVLTLHCDTVKEFARIMQKTLEPFFRKVNR